MKKFETSLIWITRKLSGHLQLTLLIMLFLPGTSVGIECEERIQILTKNFETIRIMPIRVGSASNVSSGY